MTCGTLYMYSTDMMGNWLQQQVSQYTLVFAIEELTEKTELLA